MALLEERCHPWLKLACGNVISYLLYTLFLFFYAIFYYGIHVRTLAYFFKRVKLFWLILQTMFGLPLFNTFLKAIITYVRSFFVVSRPNDIRILFVERALLPEIAYTVYDGSEPCVPHALPSETRTPSRSRSMSRRSASIINGKYILIIPGTDFFGFPFGSAKGKCFASSKRKKSLNATRCAHSFFLFSSQRVMASAIPTIPGTFSVPGRRLLSCFPP